jgi:hypothetical protein
MSELSEIVVPLGIQRTDIVAEISDLSRAHAQENYFNTLIALPADRQWSAVQDAALQIPMLIRELSVCHDLALSQVVRAGRGSTALQTLLLGGGLENILKFDPSGQHTMAQYFIKYLTGQSTPPKSTSVYSNEDRRIVTLRSRMTSLAGSERAGVGLGALACIFSLTHFIIAGYGNVPSRAGGNLHTPTQALVVYRDLLETAMREISSSVSGRRALAFGATQASALVDELFTVLVSRIPSALPASRN